MQINDKGMAQTAASLECKGRMGNREPVHSQCPKGSWAGPLMNIWIKNPGIKPPLWLKISSSLTFTSHTSACVCGHRRSSVVYFHYGGIGSPFLYVYSTYRSTVHTLLFKVIPVVHTSSLTSFIDLKLIEQLPESTTVHSYRYTGTKVHKLI